MELAGESNLRKSRHNEQGLPDRLDTHRSCNPYLSSTSDQELKYRFGKEGWTIRDFHDRRLVSSHS